MSRRFFVLTFLLLSIIRLQAQTYQQWLEKSYLAADGKDWTSAIEYVHNALKSEPANPQNGWLLSNMGTYQRNLGLKAEALQTYTNGLLFAPKSVTLLLNRAALLLEIGSLQLALNDYSSVLSLDEKNCEAWLSTGEIKIALNDTVGARRSFDEALAIEPRNIRALSGKALVLKINRQYDESEKIYNQLLSHFPDNQELLFNRAELYFLFHKQGKALVDINKAIKIADKDALSYFLRGKIHFALYEQDFAHQDFLKAKELGYRSEELLYWLKKSR